MEKIVLNTRTPVMDVEPLIGLGNSSLAEIRYHIVDGVGRLIVDFGESKEHRCFVGESLYFRKRSGTGGTSTWEVYGEAEVKVLSIIDEHTIEVSMPTESDYYTIISADSADKTISLNKSYPLLPEDFMDVGFDFGATLYNYNDGAQASIRLCNLHPVFRHDSSLDETYNKNTYDRTYINTIDFAVSQGVDILPKVTGYTYEACSENINSIKYENVPNDENITGDYPEYIYTVQCTEEEEERTDYHKVVKTEFDYIALSAMPLYMDMNPYVRYRVDETIEGDVIFPYEGTELIRKREYYEVKVGISANEDYNLLQQNTIQDFFSYEIKEKSIPKILDMEKVMFEPRFISGETNDAIEQLVFNFHFRSRECGYSTITGDVSSVVYSTAKSGIAPPDPANPFTSPKYAYETNNAGTTYVERKYNADWSVVEGTRKGWNGLVEGTAITGNTFRNSEELSDLLGYLDFSDDDVMYQKQKIKKSFVRLSFYDSDNVLDQQLLGYSTIFLDSGELAGKLYKNRQADPLFGVETYTGTTEEERLSTQLVIRDKYNTDKSSEGFYIYLFKDEVDEVNTAKTIYMKVEFNHAGKGKTIPFIKPHYTVTGATTATRAVGEGSTPGPQPPTPTGVKTLTAVPFNEYFQHLFIKLKVMYIKDSEPHYVYCIDEDVTNETGNPIKYKSDNKKLVFCLYEPLI